MFKIKRFIVAEAFVGQNLLYQMHVWPQLASVCISSKEGLRLVSAKSDSDVEFYKPKKIPSFAGKT